MKKTTQVKYPINHPTARFPKTIYVIDAPLLKKLLENWNKIVDPEKLYTQGKQAWKASRIFTLSGNSLNYRTFKINGRIFIPTNAPYWVVVDEILSRIQEEKNVNFENLVLKEPEKVYRIISDFAQQIEKQ